VPVLLLSCRDCFSTCAGAVLPPVPPAAASRVIGSASVLPALALPAAAASSDSSQSDSGSSGSQSDTTASSGADYTVTFLAVRRAGLPQKGVGLLFVPLHPGELARAGVANGACQARLECCACSAAQQ